MKFNPAVKTDHLSLLAKIATASVQTQELSDRSPSKMTISFETFRGSADHTIVKGTTTKPDLTGTQVHIKTTHSGICGTDLHCTGMDMSLGHECVGTIAAIGPDVKTLKVGDRVGWGYVRKGCEHCSQCLQGYNYYCLNGSDQYFKTSFDQGSFGTGAVWDEGYVFKIPDAMASEDAAPLMCGGWTVWNALSRYGVKSGDSVGVIGIGGLGHLAIQFAAKMGCEVTAFSTTEAKREEAMTLGAHHFVATKRATELKVPRKIDHLLIETNAHPDLSLFLPILSPRAAIYPQQIPTGFPDWNIPFFPLLLQGVSIIFATTGPRHEISRMLEFAALHGVKPVLERFPLTKEGIDTSIKRLEDGQMRYRGVLVAEDA
jgi:D-arabinose 1-dehydrogenase-like Zn-dependent alcohol dehydrogenase